MIAKLLRGISEFVLGREANQTAFHPLPQLPTLGVSRQAVEKMHRNGGIVTDEDVTNLRFLKKNSDTAAKNAKQYSKDCIGIANNEITIADAHEKARRAAEKSQIKQGLIQAKGWGKTQQAITSAEEAIAKAGGGEL